MTIEKRLLSLEKRCDLLYQRTYARYTRRAYLEKNAIDRARRWEKHYARNRDILRRALLILAKKPVGTRNVYLTTKEINKFKFWLKKDFRRN